MSSYPMNAPVRAMLYCFEDLCERLRALGGGEDALKEATDWQFHYDHIAVFIQRGSAKEIDAFLAPFGGRARFPGAEVAVRVLQRAEREIAAERGPVYADDPRPSDLRKLNAITRAYLRAAGRRNGVKVKSSARG